jgi:hypothetical protein
VRVPYAKTRRERLHVYAQMGRRLAAVPLIPLRKSRFMSKLRGVKSFS